jgi:hypothetical protein
MRSRFFDFAHVLIGKPVPTFPGHALSLHAGYGPPDMQPTRLRDNDFGMIIVVNDN